ncbi:MGMT family protein [Asticcacaulis sp. AC402]|uniref:MGMT family protein n=1 Tax=Asticcacaulis sp. AC402 TaxID=1282361 RepID=UPI0009E5D15A|nr:MGMT family protein [Asticcacaulis sp. AC402]
MTKRKSALDHLDPSRSPHIVHVIPPGAPGYREAKGGSMVISTPAEVDALIRRVDSGQVVTLDDIRQALARRHSTAVACPVSTAIFINMAARAAEARRARGEDPETLTPWWRVLKTGGLLNPKLPGGIERQQVLLAAEGVRASPLRRHLAVYDYEARRPAEPLENLP